MSESMHNILLRQAVEAIKEGDREAARQFLEEILQEDDENVRAWLLLARVTENEAEKRMALTTVLQLEPDNERARTMLEKLDGALEVAPGDEEIIPGVSRRQFILIAGGVGAFVVLMVMIIAAVAFSGNQSRSADNRRQTQTAESAAVAFANQTQAVLDVTVTAESVQATALAENTATPTATNTRPAPQSTLPPTWTPQPQGVGAARATPLPPPANVSGRLLGWSGTDTLNIGYLPIVYYDLSAGGIPVQIGQNFGSTVTSPDGQRIYYARYFRQTREVGPEAIDLDGGNMALIAERWANSTLAASIDDIDEPKISEDGTLMVFTALSTTTFTRGVFLLNLEAAEGEDPLTPLTNDPNGDYSEPSISADNARVVAIRTRTNGQPLGADIVVIDLNAGFRQNELTTDGDATVESNPTWSPDSRSLAYAAQVQGERNRDIVITSADGSVSFSPVVSDADDILPVYSPDGISLAFSSDRTGSYDIFIYEFRTQTLSQLTDSEEDDFVSDWVLAGG